MVTSAGVDVGTIVEAGGTRVKVEDGFNVGVTVAASGVERGGLPEFEQAAKNRITNKDSTRFIFLFIFYIHRVRVHHIILTIDNVHVAG